MNERDYVITDRKPTKKTSLTLEQIITYVSRRGYWVIYNNEVITKVVIMEEETILQTETDNEIVYNKDIGYRVLVTMKVEV
jgi:hypothetical protein